MDSHPMMTEFMIILKFHALKIILMQKLRFITAGETWSMKKKNMETLIAGVQQTSGGMDDLHINGQ